MSYKPVIEVNTATLVDVDIKLAQFHLEIDGDEESDYTGIFEGPTHDITFYGPTPDHVLGAAHRYAGKLTEGEPYKLEVVASQEADEALVPLP